MGVFDSESAARASLEPEALERALARRARQDQRLAVIAAIVAGVTALLAVVGMLTLLA